MSDTNGTTVRQCGTCKHWVRSPVNRMDLSDIRGDCRRHPPQVTVICGQGPRGELSIVGQVCQWPSLPEKYPPCGEYARLVQLVVE